MTTFTTGPAEAAFLRAILENPAEDTHRLVYADWLDENGQPERAEFMRVQCELAAKPDNGECYGCSSARTGRTDAYSQEEAKKPCRCTPLYQTLRCRERELSAAIDKAFALPDGMYWTIDSFPIGNHISHAVVSRGFVSHVTLTAAAFLGGVCGTCQGNGGYVYGLEEQQDWCWMCNGTGRTDGVARELFAAHPIERVTLSDREPDDNVHTAPSWTWWEGEIGDDSDRIPKDVFDLIDLPSCFDMGEWRKSADTRDAALAALSAACVRHGRSRAALPPLPSGQPAASS